LLSVFLFNPAYGEVGRLLICQRIIMHLSILRSANPVAPARAIALAIVVSYSMPSFAQITTDNTLSTVVVTATRTPQETRDIISDNSVITSDEIAQSGQKSLVELLQQQRGIEITTSGGSGTTSSVFIRGANNAQSIVLVNGVRVQSSTAGGATWEDIPLSQIDRIEIVYGPLSTMYGADALGGVIQIFTKQGEGAPHVTGSVGYGTYNTRSMNVGVYGSTEGDHKFSYALSGGHDSSDGFDATKPANSGFGPDKDKDGYARDSASGQMSLEMAKGQEVGFLFLQSRLNAQFDNGYSVDPRNINQFGSYALYSKNQITDIWHSQMQVSQGVDKSNTVASGSTLYSFNTVQNEVSWQNDLKIGTDVLQLLFGRREENVDTDSGTGIDGSRTTNYEAVSYLLKRGANIGNLSIRNDNNSQFGSHTTGSVGYGYQFTQAWRANASFGTSFRAPTFDELYYPGYSVPNLKPEQGKNFETGIHYDEGKTQLSAVYYRNRVTDLLVNATPCPISSVPSCAYNVDKALLTGITLGASTTLGAFTVRGSLDLQNPHNETTDQQLARTAKQHGSVAVEYAAGKLKTGIENTFSAKRPDFDYTANAPVTLGGYALWNLYASYDVARNWSLFARWNNVLDKDYELAKGYATPGSNVFVGIRYGM
jgi:vitamin B12 transporter